MRGWTHMMATMGVRRRHARLVVLVGVVSALVSASSMTATAAKPALRLQLAANVVPVPDFDASGSGPVSGAPTPFPNPCVALSSAGAPYFVTNDRNRACTTYVLAAIDHARRLEGVGPMVLPSNWFRLSTAQQIFVVTDLERVDRGLAPYVGTTASLNAAAVRGALALADPTPPAGMTFTAAGSNWAAADSVLEADYSWMYDDGWAGSVARTSNIACTSATSSGCWQHREIMLGAVTGLNCPSCVLGTGYAPGSSALGASYTLIVVHPTAKRVALAFTWSRNVMPFLSSTTHPSPTTTARGGGSPPSTTPGRSSAP